ncbi:hypothetical protein acdb102_31810 [Acidothermaceae bacterium B102]|nr:hypothetical protein acdb102_31810 [Acidothermaceae bacterium B102]
MDLSRLLARDYWLILSTPRPGVEASDIQQHLQDHVAWLLGLEQSGVLFLSGPLLSGPGVGPGSGVSILRAADEAQAASIADQDPFVLAGLRTCVVHQWRLNEGSVSVRLSLGTGSYAWE